MQGPADMKTVAHNADGSVFREKCLGKNQVFPGIDRLIFHKNPVFRKFFFHKVVFHGRGFRAGLVASFSA